MNLSLDLFYTLVELESIYSSTVNREFSIRGFETRMELERVNFSQIDCESESTSGSFAPRDSETILAGAPRCTK